jgi:hypothetical protein
MSNEKPSYDGKSAGKVLAAWQVERRLSNPEAARIFSAETQTFANWKSSGLPKTLAPGVFSIMREYDARHAALRNLQLDIRIPMDGERLQRWAGRAAACNKKLDQWIVETLERAVGDRSKHLAAEDAAEYKHQPKPKKQND